MAPTCHRPVTEALKKDPGFHLSPCFNWSERLDSNQRPLSPQETGTSQVLEIATAFSRNLARFSRFVHVRTVTNLSPAAFVLLLALLPNTPALAKASNAVASWYGPGFHGRRTASGERFNQHAMTAAHRTLPFGTLVRVTHKGRSVTVRINDRGPFIRGRSLDLSKGAARQIGCTGVCRVSMTVVGRRGRR